ncbi:hypothetical protein B4090_4799 [Bacillus licheniformis]|nr:hypothetical protein B4090_4799 [Bacillus licheniformis]
MHYRKDQRKWRACIRVNQKNISLGQYDDPEKAARAYNKAAVEYFGEYARLNELPKEDE